MLKSQLKRAHGHLIYRDKDDIIFRINNKTYEFLYRPIVCQNISLQRNGARYSFKNKKELKIWLKELLHREIKRTIAKKRSQLSLISL